MFGKSTLKSFKTSLSSYILLRKESTYASNFVNRNPRNLEQLCIGYKPFGYWMDKTGKEFWYKLILTASNRTVTAQLVHHINGPIVEAKTSEWAIRQQLYSVKDTSAYINLGKVFAQRCLECGISEMYCDIEPLKGGKVEKFLQEIVKGGLKLSEAKYYKKPDPWHWKRPEKPWEVVEEE